MSTRLKVLLVLVAVISFAIALSYPITYYMELRKADEGMARLTALRDAGRQSAARTTEPTAERVTSEATDAPATSDANASSIAAATADAATATPSITNGAAAPRATTEATSAPATNDDDASDIAAANDTAVTATPSITAGADAPRATAEATSAPATNDDDASDIAAANDTAVTATPGTTTGADAPRATAEATSAPATNDDGASGIVAANDTAAIAMPSITTGAAATSIPAAERTPVPDATGVTDVTPVPIPTPSPTPVPTPTLDRRLRSSALSYPEKEKVKLREEDILPEYRELYEINHDLVGWITIPRTPIDYPVLQSEDREFYLKHDFFGERNNNGQIILDTSCDPYTPSYNLVISGHNLYNDTMFSTLVKYKRRDYWEAHKIVRCDVLTQEREYVAFAAFFSADYDENEEGFRYNADIQYRVDAERWLAEIRENQIYDTGIDAAFGDEFLTLTTCNHMYRKNGRFVLVCRRIREGEVF